MDPQEAADRYTGFSDRVGQEELEEALGYFEYAVAAYYVQVNNSGSLKSLAQSSCGRCTKGRSCQFVRGLALP